MTGEGQIARTAFAVKEDEARNKSSSVLVLMSAADPGSDALSVPRALRADSQRFDPGRQGRGFQPEQLGRAAGAGHLAHRPAVVARIGPTHRSRFSNWTAAGALAFRVASRTERACLWVRRAMLQPGGSQDGGRSPTRTWEAEKESGALRRKTQSQKGLRRLVKALARMNPIQAR